MVILITNTAINYRWRVSKNSWSNAWHYVICVGLYVPIGVGKSKGKGKGEGEGKGKDIGKCKGGPVVFSFNAIELTMLSRGGAINSRYRFSNCVQIVPFLLSFFSWTSSVLSSWTS